MKDSRLQTDEKKCFLCGKNIIGNREKHHIFNGNAYRKKSEDDGMFVYLHSSCHQWLHNHSKTLRNLKIKGQRRWEKECGNRDEFIKRYGKSYILEEDNVS